MTVSTTLNPMHTSNSQIQTDPNPINIPCITPKKVYWPQNFNTWCGCPNWRSKYQKKKLGLETNL